MKLQHTDPKRWNVTLKRTQLDTLMSAAKWIVEGQNGKIPKIARARLKRILEGYSEECDRLYSASNKASMLEKLDEKEGIARQEE
ncbi:MAG: hypothetical protein U5K69_20090 [Balneolaceae bacterium]|nr:hypothetical protein [Balneolaceae bacterium]